MTRGTPRLTAENFQTLAEVNGFEWIGDAVVPSSVKTRWRCRQGHEWDANYNNIQGGRRCPFCSGKAPKTIADYHQVAKRRGFRYVGTRIPANVRIRVTWQCGEKHLWDATYDDINQGSGCPFCSGVATKYPFDYCDLAAKRGLIWLWEIVPNGHTNTRWQCSKGHIFLMSFNNLSQGKGCQKCAGNAHLTEEDFHNMASLAGLTWVGTQLCSARTQTTWLCESGHIWVTNYDHVKRGQHCPKCIDMVNGVRTSKPQRDLHALVGGEINFRIGRYLVDIALVVGRVQIALEYDGWYWHDPQRDAKRDRFLIAEGWRVLHIKSGMLLPTIEQVQGAIAKLLSGASYAEIVLSDWRSDKVGSARHKHSRLD